MKITKRTYRLKKRCTAEDAVDILLSLSGGKGQFRFDDLSHDKWDDTSLNLAEGTSREEILEEISHRTVDIIGVLYAVSENMVYAFINFDRTPNEISVATENADAYKEIENILREYTKTDI